ncbi:MAG: hypothetical protein AAGD10_17680 [Myxococcota bacterium]
MLDAFIIDAIRRDGDRRPLEDRPRVPLESPGADDAGAGEDVEAPKDAVIRIDLRHAAC